MYSEEKFATLMSDLKHEHRRAATGSQSDRSDRLFERLAEPGKAIEDGELQSSIMDKAARGARFLSHHSSPSSS